MNKHIFHQAIDSTIVEVASEAMPRDTLGRAVDAFVTPYPCGRIGECRIFLRREFWNDALRNDRDIYRLILHEYLRVMSLNDENNQISSLLQMSPDHYGRTGVIEINDLANLDFETPNHGFELPLFWYISSLNAGYRLRISDNKAFEGRHSLEISSDFTRVPIFQVPGGQPFAAAVQCFDAKPYWGRAVHLSGLIETVNLISGGAGLWLRVDGAQGQTLLLDNMANRTVFGTTRWKRADVIAYIEAETAVQICFGPLLFGHGTAHFDDLRVRVIEE